MINGHPTMLGDSAIIDITLCPVSDLSQRWIGSDSEPLSEIYPEKQHPPTHLGYMPTSRCSPLRCRLSCELQRLSLTPIGRRVSFHPGDPDREAVTRNKEGSVDDACAVTLARFTS